MGQRSEMAFNGPGGAQALAKPRLLWVRGQDGEDAALGPGLRREWSVTETSAGGAPAAMEAGKFDLVGLDPALAGRLLAADAGEPGGLAGSGLAGGGLAGGGLAGGGAAGGEAGLSRDRAMLLDAIGEGVALASAVGDVLFANEFYRRLGETVRADLVNVASEAARYFADLRARRRAPGGAPLMCKFELGSVDEGEVLEAFVTPADERAPEDASAARVAIVVRDVTATRRTQQKVAAINNAGVELVRLDTEVIRKMNSLQRLTLLQDKIIRFTRDLLRFDNFAIFLIDPRTRKLELIISSGLPQEVSDLELFADEEGCGISGYVAATGRSYICRDTKSDERFIPGLSGACSSLTVPLRIFDRVVGVLDIESREPAAFNDEDRTYAEIFGQHVALALNLLDLLVVERTATNETVTDRVRNEIAEPLDDMGQHLDWLATWLTEHAAEDPEARQHLSRAAFDLRDIRQRLTNCASGPQTLLGVERAMADRRVEPGLQGKRVLIADDQLKIRKVISEVLRHRGCDVTVCGSGGEAIDHLRQVGAGDEPPFDLVLSDIRMPDRNGYEVYSAVRRHNAGCPVILMTGFGYDPHHSIVRAQQEGLEGILFKPFEIELLLERVRAALAKKEG